MEPDRNIVILSFKKYHGKKCHFLTVLVLKKTARRSALCTTEYTRPVATGGIVKTIFPHNFPKNDAQDLKKWSRKTRPVFLYNL